MHLTGKVKSIIDFSTQLVQWFTSPSNSPSRNAPDPDPYLNLLPIKQTDLSSSARLELHRLGIQLWNACCKINNDGMCEKGAIGVAKARAFSCLLLDTTLSHKHKRESEFVTFYKGTLKTTKECLSCDLLDTAIKLSECLAVHHDKSLYLMKKNNLTTENVDDLASQQEYYLLRVALAWKQDRLDLAEHFYTTFQSSFDKTKYACYDKAIDVCYEIGKQRLQIKQYETAVKWLKYASELLQDEKCNVAMDEAAEFRLNILHSYVRALLATNEPDLAVEVHQVMQILRSEFGHKLAVILLNLEVLSQDSQPNVGAYSAELSKAIRTIHILDSNHKLIMHHIHRMKPLSNVCAGKAAKQYITQRLIPYDSTEWIENAILTYLWITCSTNESDVSCSELKMSLDEIYQLWNKPLRAEAANAGLILLWRQIESSTEQRLQEQTVTWCQVGLQSLFTNAGEQNIAKVQRKLTMCYLNLSNHPEAKEMLERMSDRSKAQSTTRFLTYCLAIRSGDQACVDMTLNCILQIREKGNRLLMACIGETIRNGTQRQGAFLLQRFLDKYNYDLPSEIDTTAALRLAARLLISVIEAENAKDEEILSRLCGIFRAAAAYSMKHNSENESSYSGMNLEECLWFERSSYNVAIKHIKQWSTKHIIDLLAHSGQILFPPSSDSVVQHRKSVQLINVTYIQAVLYLSEARRCDQEWTIEDIPRTSYNAKQKPTQTEIQKSLYKNVYNQYTSLHSLFDNMLANSASRSAELEEDIQTKLLTLLPLAFEAMVFIVSHETQKGLPFDDMPLLGLIDNAKQLNAPSKTYALFADIILSSIKIDASGKDGSNPEQSPIPIKKAATLLSRVVDAIRSQPDYDIVRAARWIRCVVQMVLDEHTERDLTRTRSFDNALQIVQTVVNQALNLARSAAEAILASMHNRQQTGLNEQSTDRIKEAYIESTTFEKFGDDHNDFEMYDVAKNTEEATEAVDSTTAYPTDELEWLSITLFNLSIDCYIAEGKLQDRDQTTDEEKAGESKTWAHLAVQLADVLALLPVGPFMSGHGETSTTSSAAAAIASSSHGDSGVLARVLREKCKSLNWDF